MINQKKILVNVYGVGTNLLKFAPYHLPGGLPGGIRFSRDCKQFNQINQIKSNLFAKCNTASYRI